MRKLLPKITTKWKTHCSMISSRLKNRRPIFGSNGWNGELAIQMCPVTKVARINIIFSISARCIVLINGEMAFWSQNGHIYDAEIGCWGNIRCLKIGWRFMTMAGKWLGNTKTNKFNLLQFLARYTTTGIQQTIPCPGYLLAIRKLIYLRVQLYCDMNSTKPYR